MNISPACTELVKRFEGCRLEAYPDPGSGGDPWTIGWGATGPGIVRGLSWTQAEADARLESDLEKVGAEISNLLDTARTSQHQFDALASFTYNLGLRALMGSTLLAKHKAGNFAGVAEEFKRWNKAAGRELPGLTRRRAAEADLYRS